MSSRNSGVSRRSAGAAASPPCSSTPEDARGVKATVVAGADEITV